MSHFLAQVFFASYAEIRVFRALEWLSSISGAKSIMQWNVLSSGTSFSENFCCDLSRQIESLLSLN